MYKTAIVTVIGSAVGLAVACGGSETGPGSQVYGGNGGGAGVSGSGSGGAAGNAGIGGNAGSGGGGGSISIAGNGGQSGSGMLGDGAVCEGINQAATNKIQPADIVVVVDNSPSMVAEAGFVQQNLNGFSQQISMSGIDVHVVLISSYGGTGVCMDPPLGSGGCPTMDSNPPTFLHVNQEVGSRNGLQQIISTFPQWQGSMRAGASKHFIVITDDNSQMPAATFNTQLLALDQALFQGYKLHAVFAPTADPLTCLLNPASDPCCAPGLAAAAGTVYRELVMMTGAVAGNICLQAAGFTEVFNAVATKVVQGSGIACEWDIPQQQDGGVFDPNKVNVKFTNGMQQRDLGRVGSQSECSNFKDAWYYDNPAAPTKVFACPDVCNEMKGGQDVKIDIQFGCPVKPPVPV